MDKAGIAYAELGGVVPNPHLSKVYEGIDLCRKEQIDFLLAVGGGSVIDSAKAIGYGLTNEGDVWDFFEHTRTADDFLSLGCILTIAAGSEMSNRCVITKEDDVAHGAGLAALWSSWARYVYKDCLPRFKRLHCVSWVLKTKEMTRKLHSPGSKQCTHFIILSECRAI